MFARLAEASLSLDIGTLFVISTCVTALLGIFLLFAWMQDRIHALAWWGVAYLIGGFSGAVWRLGDLVSPPLPSNTAELLLFLAVGMIWSAARIFHGRPVLWGGMCLGAISWLAAGLSPAFAQSHGARLVLSSIIVASYTFMIAGELWRERRSSVKRRWPQLFFPLLHAAIFLIPVALAVLGVRDLGTGWVAVFAIEVTLYVVGAAFIVLVLAKDRTVGLYKAAAETDPLTGLLNRRGFFTAAATMLACAGVDKEPVSVLAFDLDHFKSINDRHGHKLGDTMLELFAQVIRKTMRASDTIGRLGGEEFVALVSGSLQEACIAAERVRQAFEAVAAGPAGHGIPATVSAGVACGSPHSSIDQLIARADSALYRAKANGRNRIETAPDLAPVAPETAPEPSTAGSAGIYGVPQLTVPILVRRSGRRAAAEAPAAAAV